MISVVIPALNEEKQIGRCLLSVLDDRSDTPVEIVLVDGGSEDRTVAITREVLSGFPAARVLSGPRGRGRQMNQGARAASGEILFFLHADSWIVPGSIPAIAATVRPPLVLAGCFRHHFDGTHPFLKVISLLHDLRFRCTRIIYGDQGLFVSRSLFLELDGFHEQGVMEDMEFSERLRRRTRPVRLPQVIHTSSRKFEAIGVYRAFAQVLRLILGYELGLRDVGGHAFFRNFR